MLSEEDGHLQSSFDKFYRITEGNDLVRWMFKAIIHCMLFSGWKSGRPRLVLNLGPAVEVVILLIGHIAETLQPHLYPSKILGRSWTVQPAMNKCILITNCHPPIMPVQFNNLDALDIRVRNLTVLEDFWNLLVFIFNKMVMRLTCNCFRETGFESLGNNDFHSQGA